MKQRSHCADCRVPEGLSLRGKRGLITPTEGIVHGDALCFMGKTWVTHKTTETVLNNGWRLAAVGGWRLVVGGWRRLVVGGWWLAAVGGWRLVVDGGWRLADGGAWELYFLDTKKEYSDS